ncbi:MAG: NUDIX domain-containing protein [Candidatus Izimaplasma sp.]|nr:NUDIX domain-containing protein [Candidatus Izimaplasma bacterium]
MEYFDLYNKTGQKLNKKVLRDTKLNNEEYHIVVNVWIKNNKGQYLIQQRNKLSDRNPFMWAATAGSAVAGDTSLKTAIKETQEELGIKLNPSKLKFLKRYIIEDNFANFILDVYLIKEDISLQDLTIDKLEVKDVKYASMSKIYEQVLQKTFINYINISKHKGYFDLIEKS